MEKPYRVTPLAGTHVAGARVRDADILAGKKPLMLSEAAAEHPLRQGAIVPFEDEAPALKGKKD